MLTRGQLCADRALRESKAVGCLIGLAVGDAIGDLGRDSEYRKRYGLAIELHRNARSTDDTDFSEIFTRVPLTRYILNTVGLLLANIIGGLLSVPLIAYAFARLRFPGRDMIFFIVVATMMVPPQVTLIPLYSLYQRIGLIDTYWPLILPYFFGNPFLIFLVRQYIKTLPRDLDDAARIDGAGTWGILYRIILPLRGPALTIVIVYTFLWTWNDFINPLVYITNTDLYPIQLGLSMFRGRFTVEWHLLMAAALVSVVPQLVIYFFAQRQLIGGIASVGLKG